MKLTVDAHYTGNKAKVVGVLLENFSNEKSLKIISKAVVGVAPYES
jgi:deoxyinosine 3'endonuclease